MSDPRIKPETTEEEEQEEEEEQQEEGAIEMENDIIQAQNMLPKVQETPSTSIQQERGQNGDFQEDFPDLEKPEQQRDDLEMPQNNKNKYSGRKRTHEEAGFSDNYSK